MVRNWPPAVSAVAPVGSLDKRNSAFNAESAAVVPSAHSVSAKLSGSMHSAGKYACKPALTNAAQHDEERSKVTHNCSADVHALGVLVRNNGGRLSKKVSCAICRPTRMAWRQTSQTREVVPVLKRKTHVQKRRCNSNFLTNCIVMIIHKQHIPIRKTSQDTASAGSDERIHAEQPYAYVAPCSKHYRAQLDAGAKLLRQMQAWGLSVRRNVTILRHTGAGGQGEPPQIAQLPLQRAVRC
jgi:hypothetical protein